MFGFYKTNGFTPLSCLLEMAANRFHAHYDSTSETTSHRANGNTELCRYYSTCACATGIKVHVSLVVTLREHSVFRISRMSPRPLVAFPRRTPASRFNMHLVDTFLSVGQNADCHSSYQAWPHNYIRTSSITSDNYRHDDGAFLNTSLIRWCVFFFSQMIRLKFMTNHMWYAVMLHPWPTENIWLVFIGDHRSFAS